MCMGGSKVPPPPPIPASPKTPDKVDEAVQMARDDERKRARAMSGTTVKTSGMGLTDPAQTGKKTLIGA